MKNTEGVVIQRGDIHGTRASTEVLQDKSHPVCNIHKSNILLLSYLICVISHRTDAIQSESAGFNFTNFWCIGKSWIHLVLS